MSRQEIEDLLKQIKVFYPRFEAVEKDDGRYTVSEAVTDSWYSRIGYMSFDKAMKILDQYMLSDDHAKTPHITLWINGGKMEEKAKGGHTAALDMQHGVILWQPDPEGAVYEIKCWWDQARGAWTDEEGRLWAKP